MGQPNLNTSIISGWFFPFPPRKEQERIVTLLTQLLALCDGLEVKLKQQRDHADRLAQAIVNAVVNGKAPTRD
jgi:type I restriction enzyme S subunit